MIFKPCSEEEEGHSLVEWSWEGKGSSKHPSIHMGRFYSKGETLSEGVGRREADKEMKERQN